MPSFVYILTNKRKTVLYIGVTSDLAKRLYEHKNGITKGFAWKYNCDQLVFYEGFLDIRLAIEREKELKKWSRRRKEELISRQNPGWADLSDKL